MYARIVRTLTVLCAAGTLFGGQAADTRINLFKEKTFEPVYMHGMVTAARGWCMHDGARDYSIRSLQTYLSGEECFKLSFADGVFSIVFKKPLNPCYKHGRVLFYGDIAFVTPPADHYSIEGRLKFKNAKPEFHRGPKLPVSDDWQNIKLEVREPVHYLVLNPEEGAEYHFSELAQYPEYPKIGGSIALPEGGKLEKFLLPKDASYELRIGVAMWRGWLWKLTGVALPIETVDKVTGPVEGAFVAVKGPERPGLWSLKVDKNGIFLSYGSELEVEVSVFDYLRRSLGCAFYTDDLQKIPAQGSVKELPKLEFSAKPHYTYFNTCRPLCTMQGGCDYSLLYTRNDVDYYHLPVATSDHVFNVLVPQERYYASHPEYFMDTGSGTRVVRENPHYTQNCMSNPEFLELLLKNAVEYTKAQYGPLRLVIDAGDSVVHCQCKNCVKLNKGTTSCSNAIYAFHEELAKRVAKIRPELVVERAAYHSRIQPPDNISKLSDNVRMMYCMNSAPCSLHLDCALAKRTIGDILKLRKLVGDDPGKMSFMFYWDLRPIYTVKLMQELNKYGSDCIFFWYYRSFHPSIPFLLGRWNLGEDPEKLLKEFEEANYGKGAPFVHQVFEAAEEFAANYKHAPGDLKSATAFRIWPDNFGNAESVMDRPAFDKIHALFAKALEAAGGDRTARRNICRDWLFFLAEDLNKYRAPSCRTDEELREFAKRLAIVVKMGEEFPGYFSNLMFRIPARDFLSGVTGVAIPNTCRNWAQEPVLRNIITAPEKHLERGGERFTGSGIYFKPVFFKSRFDDTNPYRANVKISDYHRDNQLLAPTQEMTLEIPLDAAVTHPLALSIEGAVQNKGVQYPVSIAVNGKEFYRGNAPFAADRWTRMGLSIPPELLKKGDNTLRIRNLSSTAGWMAISEIYVIDVSGDFAKFASGDKNALWREFHDSNTALTGGIKAGKGKVFMTAKQGGKVELSYFAHLHTVPKIAVTPGGTARMRVRASGRGTLKLQLYHYSPYELDKDGMQILRPSGYLKHVGFKGLLKSDALKLGPNFRTYSFDFKIPKTSGLVFPDIVVTGGQAEIAYIEVVPLPPKK